MSLPHTIADVIQQHITLVSDVPNRVYRNLHPPKSYNRKSCIVARKRRRILGVAKHPQMPTRARNTPP